MNLSMLFGAILVLVVMINVRLILHEPIQDDMIGCLVVLLIVFIFAAILHYMPA